MARKDAEIRFRVESELAEAAKDKAARLHVPLSLVLRQLLRRWLKKDDTEAERDLIDR